MNDYKNFCEYCYTPEQKGKTLLWKGLLISLYTIFAAAYLFFFWVLLEGVAFLIMLPFIMLAVIRITWKYVNVEYEIAIEAGELTVAKIYGGTKRRTKKRVYIPEMTLIARYDEQRAAKLGSVSDISNYEASPFGEGSYVCVYPDKKRGKKPAIVIDTNEEVRRILRLCNPSAFERG